MKRSQVDSLHGISRLEEYHFTSSSHRYLNSRAKRLVDICGAVTGMLIGLPLFLLSVIIVKVVDGDPAIFSQDRYGLGGKPFLFYKLRTLQIIEKREPIQIQRIQYKPQYSTTTTGRFWRVTSIDEIVQFWLVLKGEMSLIGHRPIPIYYLPYLEQMDGMSQGKIDHYLTMISCYKPGMSSLSSVNGRGDLSMQQKMEYDLIYAQHANFILDASLLLRTLIAVITRRGAR